MAHFDWMPAGKIVVDEWPDDPLSRLRGKPNGLAVELARERTETKAELVVR